MPPSLKTAPPIQLLSAFSYIVFCYLIFCCIVVGHLAGCRSEDPVSDALPGSARSEPVIEDSVSPTHVADSLLALSEEFTGQARYDSALVFATLAGEAYEELGHNEGQIRSAIARGLVLERSGRLGEALDNQLQTLDQALTWLGEEHLAVAETYNRLAAIHEGQGNYFEGLDFSFKALEIRKKQLGDSHVLVGKSLSNVGVLYAGLGDFDRAITYYEDALSVMKKELGENDLELALLYNNIGVALKNVGDYDRSLEYHEQALSLREQGLGERHPAVGASYYNIGITNSMKGDYESALANHETSLNIWQEAFPEGHPLIAYNYNAISIDLQSLNQLEEALRYERKALGEKMEKLSSRHHQVGLSYLNIGNIYKRIGDYKEALFYFGLCIENWENTLGTNNPLWATVYGNIGTLLLEENNPQKALDYAQLSFSAVNFESLPFEQYSNLNLEHFSSERALLNALLLRARALNSLGTPDRIATLLESLLTYGRVSEVIDGYRRSVSSDGSKLLLAEEASAVYEEAIATAHRLYLLTGDIQYWEKAFYFAEKGKVSILIDAMNEADARQFAGIPDSLLGREKELRTFLAFHDRSIKAEETRGNEADHNRIAGWKNEAFLLKNEYETLLDTLEQAYPKYYELKYSDFTATVEDVRRFVLDENEVFIEYVVGEDSLMVYTITDDYQALTVTPRDSTLERMIEDFRDGIVLQDRHKYVANANKLYRMLLGPVEETIVHKSDWVIVPDGPLNAVPFEALLKDTVAARADYDEMPFLVKDHTIRYTYSATIEIGKKRGGESARRGADSSATRKDFIAFAPVFKDGVEHHVRGTRVLEHVAPFLVDESGIHGHLPQSRYEVKTIASLFKKQYSLSERWFGDRTSVFLNQNASEHSVKSVNLRDYRYVHFATHGVVNKDVPELSGIVLAQDTVGGEDGVLHLGEIYNLELDADLVVLSACQTGLGKVARGEGLMGLTRGFMYAGTDALLASLWQVEDRSTREIMEHYYREILAETTPAEALRKAKLRLQNEHYLLASPYYWAGFILIGE